jgi:hypothetical protein
MTADWLPTRGFSMNRTEFLSTLLVAALILCAGTAFGQDNLDEPDQTQDTQEQTAQETLVPQQDTAEVVIAEEPSTYDDYTVKAYTLSIFGGYFSGATFFSLPPLEDRTFVEAGSNDVMGYDGEWLILDPNIYGAPTKEIQPGTGWGTQIGIYLSDSFHLDLALSFASTSATIDMLNLNPSDPDNPYIERVPGESGEDTGVSIITGGAALIYDARSFRLGGIYPFVGFGLGGIINSFTELEDKTALYFRGLGGLKYDLSRKLIVFAQANLTTFSYPTEELNYTTQVTYFDLYLGLALFIDTIPPEVRAAHELESGG